MKKIYLTFRQKYTNKGVRYNPSYFLDKMYEDYLNAWLTKLKDTEIPENRYTAELAPWIKKQTKFAVWEYDENYIDKQWFIDNIMNVWSEFGIDVFDTIEEAKQWIRDNTDLVEESDGVFILQEAWTDIDWEIVEAKYLIID